MAAIRDKSSPREIMTIPIPQLRMTRAAEFVATTPKLPSVANPWIEIENAKMSAKVTAITTYSSCAPC